MDGNTGNTTIRGHVLVGGNRAADTGVRKLTLQSYDDDVYAILSAKSNSKVSDLPCNIRREGGQSLVIGGPSLVILEGKACNPL